MPDDNQNMDNDDTGAVISDHTSPAPPTSTADDTLTAPGPETTNTSQTTNSPEVTTDNSMQVLTDEKKNSSGKKVIATIFGVLFLVGGIAAGVFLVQRQQNLEEQAASGAECSQSTDCVLFDEPGNAGSQSVTKPIKYLEITNQPGNNRRFEQGQNNDGCYNVSVSGRDFTWQKVGQGPQCKDVSNIQVWMGEEQPTLSASCEEVQAYDESWNLLSANQLSDLSPGDNVKFAVKGTTHSGTIDKARFRVNSSEWLESTDLKPGETSTYFINYTIPEDTKDFTVNGQVHLVENDNWY